MEADYGGQQDEEEKARRRGRKRASTSQQQRDWGLEEENEDQNPTVKNQKKPQTKSDRM